MSSQNSPRSPGVIAVWQIWPYPEACKLLEINGSLKWLLRPVHIFTANMQHLQEAACTSRSQASACRKHSLYCTSHMCVDCFAAINRPDHAAWHILDSLGCQHPMHMVRQGFIMLTLLGWGLECEPIIRDLPIQRHCTCWHHLLFTQSLRSSNKLIVLPTTSRTILLTPKALAAEIISSEPSYKTMRNF